MAVLLCLNIYRYNTPKKSKKSKKDVRKLMNDYLNDNIDYREFVRFSEDKLEPEDSTSEEV